eukprot:CAMPEP_0202014728 /NCGR_PEP_ID=MMETSP0905-20130828/29965_1 /ASSEMBLY_ACC=CAM_ASM_000554 /TAXON_ID=420261 /ORGANISM="Thalassiosira antarctica, Strain CCMP982" /LENGTH=393 /DNA_ID=CAMNT_0048574709 /DNA_START=96 /DNA_END=1274 /DNA_ORIENTATION=+
MEPPQILSNNDVLLRTMEFLGPRHTCIGIGATCQDLRQLSQCNSLWRVFWETRCLFPEQEERNPSDESCGATVHKAASVFRHAIHEMDLTDKIHASCMKNKSANRPISEEDQSEAEEESTVLYSAYIQKHSMMKLTNLRVEPFAPRQLKNNNEIEQSSNLESPLCSQTWPGQASLVDNPNNMRNRVVTCQKSADGWCDHPTCKQARCGPKGCLRAYRFLLPDYSLSASGGLVRECSERNYDYITFVKCSWCSVSFCNEHVDRYYKQTKDRPTGRSWYNCDECQLSSCPDCVSQVFPSPPDMNGCRVVTAGRPCRRNVCTKCIWYVGKEKQRTTVGIPGGDYAQSGEESEIITVKGAEATAGRDGQEWEEVETACSKCLRHVEFRWKELEQVQD